MSVQPLPRRSRRALAAGLITPLIASAVFVGSTTFAAAPANDDPVGATPLDVPGVIVQDTTEATTSALETGLNDFCGAPVLEHGVWFTATATESVTVGIDVTGSNYSAGILVAQGTPDALEPLLCGPGVVAGFADAGTTYYVLVFGDGLSEATSGNLVLETFVAPPPPTVDLTIDPVAKVTRAGVARLTGSVTCTSDDENAFLFDVSGDMTQKVGRFLIRGFFYAEQFTPCDGVTRTWQADVIGENGVFAGGKAATVAYAFGCGFFDCGVGYAETTVSLRRSGK